MITVRVDLAERTHVSPGPWEHLPIVLGDSSQAVFSLVIVLILLAVGIVVGYVVVRRARAMTGDVETFEPFTLHDFRQMRDRGEITEVEYQAMRAALLGRMHAELAEGRSDATPAGDPARDTEWPPDEPGPERPFER